jgi:regulator of sigma E protease
MRSFRYAPLAIGVAYLVWMFGTDWLVTLGAFGGILLFLVVMHELGHFTVAKLIGVRVLEFGVGLPPKAWGIKHGETEYTVNWLPLGGFVRMLGEEDPCDPRSLAAQAAWKRLAVFAAGPGVNALLPLILLFIAFLVPTQVFVTDVAVVGVSSGSPAEAAGIQQGDIIREAGGHEILNSTTLQRVIQTRLGGDTDWVIERQGRLIEVHINEVRVDPPASEGATGIALTNARVTVASVKNGSTASTSGIERGDLFLRVGSLMVLSTEDASTAYEAAIAAEPDVAVVIQMLRRGRFVELSASPSLGDLSGFTANVKPEERRSSSIAEAISGAFTESWEILVTFRNEIGRMVSGSTGIELAGPVGIAQITGQVLDEGIGPLVTWAALLSINLAIVNILPIPALDGGRITFVLLELVRGGRRISPDKERAVHMAGFALLMSAIMLVTFNDIQRLVGGFRFFD